MPASELAAFLPRVLADPSLLSHVKGVLVDDSGVTAHKGGCSRRLLHHVLPITTKQLSARQCTCC